LLLPKKLILGPALLCAAAAFVFPAQAPAPAAGGDPTLAEINEITADLARISGLKPLGPVQCDRIPKDRVKAFLEERVKDAVKPDEILAEEAALKKFGFVPQDFDLKTTTLDLMSEQAAAFYDFRKKRLFMIDGGPDPARRPVLAHELAHALADQHFHLEKFIEHASKNDDSSLARMAVMEGQATWLMSEYLTQQSGQSLKDSPVLVKLMSQAEVSEGQFPVFDHAPLYLRETLLFPYTQGMLFQHAVFEKLGPAAFAEVFRRPPVTTQQILHPQKYFDNMKAVRPALPEMESQHGYRNFTEGELGELDHSILLRQYVGDKEAAEIAPAWRGGFFRLLQNKAEKRMVLAYASEWSGPDPARRFFAMYRKILAGKWKTFEIESESDDALAGLGDDGYFLLRLEGTRITSLEGLEFPQRAKPALQRNPVERAMEPAIH
jgi:hypothetical protein